MNEILARRLTIKIPFVLSTQRGESISNAVERKLELKSPDSCILLKPMEAMYVCVYDYKYDYD